MLRVWNVTLVIITFFLTIFGTFMTRSGIVQSVHAFGQDPLLTKLFTAFMVGLLVFSFSWVIYRLPLLRARNELDSWMSREAAFLANNWVLLFASMFILFATMFPTLSEAVTGERLTVGPPFFNKWMLPIGLVMLVLTGIGPLLAWRKSTISNVRNQFLMPTALAVVAAIGLAALGVRVWTSGLCWALCAFVVGTVTQEFWRGARVRQSATGTDVITALIGLVSRNKRRYGGYIVHIGIVLIFLGFAGQGYNHDEEAQLKPGQQVKVGAFTIRNDALKVTDDGAKQMVTAHLTIFEGGKEVGKLYPAKWYFRKHEEQPTTEVAMRRTLTEDLYIVMPASDAATQSVSLAVHINPLVNWVWFGFGVLAVGTAIALMPEAAFSFALARMPAGAVTTSLLLLVLLWPAGVFAQGQTVPAIQRSQVRRQLESQIMCTCGCRAPMGSCPMRPNCSHYDQQAALLDRLLAKGDGPDVVKAAFIKQFGGEDILMAPPDEGFNRLAWLLPYVVGVAGLFAIVFTARRWSKGATEGADVQIDPDVDARVDDELRNLD